MKIFLSVIISVFILIPLAFVLAGLALYLIGLIIGALVYITEFMARTILYSILWVVHLMTIPFAKAYDAIKNNIKQ